MKPPEWLPEFSFLQTQWSEVVALSQPYPDLKSHDLNADWTAYTLASQQNSQTTDWFALLRQFRKSRLAYLAYHDLYMPIAEHLDTMHRVSDLAELLIQKAHQVAAADMAKKHGLVRNVDGEPIEMMVWALGKLGTRELNYSSDVDLVFLYAQEGKSDGKRSLDASSYFTRLGQKAIKLLDHFTREGQVYRVDMRLRPFGSVGPLVCSVTALQQYLQYEGREWERFAWMRARMVSGQSNGADVVQGIITPFIYRRHLDYTVFSALAKIKTDIAGHLDYAEDDLKQGVGGIRAVEFIVQSLQLVFGGRNTALQGYAISDQIQQLVNAGKLPANDGVVLNQAWLCLRKLENISQSVADQATHAIPDSAVVRQVLCNVLTCENWQQAQQFINQQRSHIEQIFNHLFVEVGNQQQLTDEQRQQLQKLMHDISNRRLPRKRQENIELLLQNSLQLASGPVVKVFLALVKKIATRPNYILMLLKETNVHQSLLNLMAEDAYFVTVLQNYPVLLEQLFEREIFTPFTFDNLVLSWQKRTPHDVEDWMEALRYFKLEHQFNLMLAWSEQQLSHSQTLQQMTALAEFILSVTVRYSHQEMIDKLGESGLSEDHLIIIAYGSAATAQMTVGSDLDLVFIVDSDQLSANAHLFAQKWVRRVIHHLTTPMYHGKLYESDMQLRPNGNSGALVTTKKEFARYQADQAWAWEHAAMVKSKTVYATAQQAQWFQKLRSEILQTKRDAQKVDQALIKMAGKLEHLHQNKSHQTEFNILAAVLNNSHQFPQLTATLNLADLHAQLIELNLLEPQPFLGIKKDPAS